jgi:hypothetical protein
MMGMRLDGKRALRAFPGNDFGVLLNKGVRLGRLHNMICTRRVHENVTAEEKAGEKVLSNTAGVQEPVSLALLRNGIQRYTPRVLDPDELIFIMVHSDVPARVATDDRATGSAWLVGDQAMIMTSHWQRR